MNYRHAYHAGSFADVVKHTVLLQLLDYLQKKSTPYCYIDTHAGEGAYDLTTASAQKTQEAQNGINKLLSITQIPPYLDRYLTLVKSSNNYPGSPLIAAKTMRAGDSLILNEKHLATYQRLKQNLAPYKNVAIHQRDAYEFLPAVLPPKEKRGLVFIDPAFEVEDEISQITHCLKQCHQRWPQGMYLIWLPIVGRTFYTARDLSYGFTKFITIEFCVDTPSKENLGLIGCSLLLINPPWQIETLLKPMLEYLWQVLHISPDSQLLFLIK